MECHGNIKLLNQLLILCGKKAKTSKKQDIYALDIFVYCIV